MQPLLTRNPRRIPGSSVDSVSPPVAASAMIYYESPHLLPCFLDNISNFLIWFFDVLMWWNYHRIVYSSENNRTDNQRSFSCSNCYFLVSVSIPASAKFISVELSISTSSCVCLRASWRKSAPLFLLVLKNQRNCFINRPLGVSLCKWGWGVGVEKV